MKLRNLVLTALLMVLTIAGISAKNAHAAGEVWAWGNNYWGQLGGGIGGWGTPFQVSGLTNITSVGGGAYHSLAVKNDGTVWALGSNCCGQLGDGTTNWISNSIPVQALGLTGIITVAGGAYHSLAVKNDGTVWAWGANWYGSLGDGTWDSKSTPIQVLGLTGITSVAGGWDHSLAVKNDGTVWAWGYNGYGELGDGTNNWWSNTPVQVLGLTGVIAIAAGEYHSIAVKNDGTVWAWGWNGYGQLGNGTTNGSNIPVQVLGLTGITSVAGGLGHSLALKNDGTVWTWGDNMYGQLGDGTYDNKSTPVQVLGLTSITAIARGDVHSLTLKNDGTVWTWGHNGQGQLGDGTYDNKSIPVQVSGLTGITAIAGGYWHSLAIISTSPANYINKAIADVKSAAYIGPGKQQNALLDKLNNALSAIQTDPPNTTLALAEMNDFYIILCNMKKQGKIDSDTYTMLYNDYVSIVTSLGGAPKPTC